MDFRIGDKVSFINEKQDGFIVSIKANGFCVVEIEDGFTLDALPTELVKTKEIQKKKSGDSKEKEVVNETVGLVVPDFIKTYLLDGCVAILSIPDNGKILTGAVEYWLVNGSDLEVLYVFSSYNAKMPEGVCAGQLNKNQSIILKSFSRETIIDINHFQIDLLFHKDGIHPQLPHLSKELKIELPTLTQNYPKAGSPYSFAVINNLINFTIQEDPNLNELFEKYKDDYNDNRKISKPANTANQFKKTDNTLKQFGLSGSLEIDLHIEELIDDPSGMAASEMIEMQLKHFRKELDKAMYNRSPKIIFIHGIGNGKLKNSIRFELKNLNINYRDGAYDRFGAGATEAILN